MGMDAQNVVVLSDEAQKKFDECVAALTAMRYGPDGPPRDTTFSEIEAFGHEVGRMLGRAVDQRLTSDHASHLRTGLLLLGLPPRFFSLSASRWALMGDPIARRCWRK